MLPFLKRKNDEAIVSTKVMDRNASQSPPDMVNEAYVACMRQVLKAIHENNPEQFSELMKSAHDLMHEMMNEEPQQEKHLAHGSFISQNVNAVKR